MENGPFEDVFPIEHGDIHGYSIVMLVYQREIPYLSRERFFLNFYTCNFGGFPDLKKNTWDKGLAKRSGGFPILEASKNISFLEAA